MRVPSAFFYKQLQSQPAHTDEPTAQLDLQVLFEGDSAFFIKTDLALKQKPKHLIFHDWRAPYWDADKCEQVKAVLCKLMAPKSEGGEGFPISIWQAGKVVELTPDNIAFFLQVGQRIKVMPVHFEDLIKVAQLPRDQIQSLDDYWLECVLREEENSRRSLYVDDFAAITDDEEKACIIDVLLSASPPLREIVNETLSHKNLQIIEQIKQDPRFSSLLVRKCYRRIIMDNPIDAIKIDPSDFEAVLWAPNSLIYEVDSEIPLRHVIPIMSSGSGKKLGELGVKKIKLYCVEDEISGLVDWLDLNLPSNPSIQIELAISIDIIHNKPALHAFSQLLEKYPQVQIKKLLIDAVMSYDLNERECEAEEAFHNLLSNIEIVEFLDKGVNSPPLLTINGNQFSQLLVAMPKVRKIIAPDSHTAYLKIMEPYTFATPIFIYGYSSLLPCLERFDMIADSFAQARSWWSSCILPYLLKNAPQLQLKSYFLSADNSGLPTYKIFDERGKFLLASHTSLMEELHLSSSRDLSVKEFNEILSNMPWLKKFNFHVSKPFDFYGIQQDLFKHLKALDVSFWEHSPLNLSILLRQLPQLRKLRVPMVFLEAEMPHLTELEFFCSKLNINFALLKTIAQYVPHLEILGLNSFSNFSLENELGDDGFISYPNLKTFRVSDGASGISVDDFLTLLSWMPRLECIVLCNMTFVDVFQTVELAPNSLPCLKTIQIEKFHKLNERLLSALLNAAPLLTEQSKREITNKIHEIQKTVARNSVRKSLASKDDRARHKPLFDQVPDQVDREASAEIARHNPDAFKNFKPTSEKKPFIYKKPDHLGQKMVVAQLSRYCQLEEKYAFVIPKIQDGICSPLSHYFVYKGMSSIQKFLSELQLWDGEKQTLTPELRAELEILLGFVTTLYLLNVTPPAQQFLGTQLARYLGQQASNTPIILINPWHKISLYKIDDMHWEIYDPNHPKGPIRLDGQSAENIADYLSSTIGHLVAVESNEQTLEPGISNINDFIDQGGLLSLVRASNGESILSQLEQYNDYSEQALTGIFTRNVEGKPAYALALQQRQSPRLKELTQRLMVLFEQKNHQRYNALLKESVELMNGYQKNDLAAELLQSLPVAPIQALSVTALAEDGVDPEAIAEREVFAGREAMLAVIRGDRLKALYEKRLSTWTPAPTVDHHLLDIRIDQTVQDSPVTLKKLIQFDSSADIDRIALKIRQDCDRAHRPFMYIDDPAMLQCASAYIRRDFSNNEGTLCKGPGGPLYDFLMDPTHAESKPVLLVNYDRFKASDLVRFNSLLDGVRTADGTPLPQDTLVIGLLNTKKPEAYQGADFFSRFDVKLTYQEWPQTPIDRPLALEAGVAKNPVVIDLYHASFWKNYLLGNWEMQGSALIFKEGPLQLALREKRPIIIRNAPAYDPDFERFWSLLRDHGVYFAGEWLHLPPETTIQREEGYAWDHLKSCLEIQQGLMLEQQEDAQALIVLNAKTASQLFGNYVCHDHALYHEVGLLDRAPEHARLDVNLTGPFTEDVWAMILECCQKKHIQLCVHAAPGVIFPEVLAEKILVVTEKSQAVPFKKEVTDQEKTQVIVSNDVDVTVSMMNPSNEAHSGWRVIDVSESNPSDLLTRIDHERLEGGLQFRFTEVKCALLQALERGERVILKGTFSSELADALAPLLLQRQQFPARALGQLILISDDDAVLNYFPSQAIHEATAAEKLACLRQKDYGDESLLKLNPLIEESKIPLSQLEARASYLKLHPADLTQGKDAWLGMYDLPGGVRLADGKLDFKTAPEEARLFMQARWNVVNAVLEENPCVFLTGLSGVGKSTFVQTYFPDAFVGEGAMARWAAESNPTTPRVLFLDEANLSHHEWSVLEGLFQNPPFIVVDGTLYPLSSNHKVIFAGNPISYGDERHLASFFERHGRAVLFEPLSKACIHELIIKPVFEGQALPKEVIESISQVILDTYAFIVNTSDTEIRISPRELQMMALMTLLRYQKNPQVNVTRLAEEMAYELGRPLIPVSAHADFAKVFPNAVTHPKPIAVSQAQGGYLVTASRASIYQHLEERLALREWRTQHQAHLNDAQQYGGLGGVILEGEPGIGKSELVIETLVAHGYHEVSLGMETVPEKSFYRMPVSMGYQEKKELLTKAFDEGAVVIIDEINSSPMMEQFLNALLMGFHPERPLELSRPLRPGFMVIGTQNPITMAGRRAASTALQRRLTSLDLPEYTHDEMIEIISRRLPKADKRDIELMVSTYEAQVKKARAERLTPAPCFRDLLSVAKDHGEFLKRLASMPLPEIKLQKQRPVSLAPKPVLPAPAPAPRPQPAPAPEPAPAPRPQPASAPEPAPAPATGPRPVPGPILDDEQAYQVILNQIQGYLDNKTRRDAIDDNAAEIVHEVKLARQTRPKIPLAKLTAILNCTYTAVTERSIENAEACAHEAKGLRRYKQSGRLAGLLLTLAALVVIGASIALSVVSLGGASPFSVLGLTLGVNYLVAGIACATGALGMAASVGILKHTSFFKESLTKDSIEKNVDSMVENIKKEPWKPQ